MNYDFACTLPTHAVARNLNLISEFYFKLGNGALDVFQNLLTVYTWGYVESITFLRKKKIKQKNRIEVITPCIRSRAYAQLSNQIYYNFLF